MNPKSVITALAFACASVASVSAHADMISLLPGSPGTFSASIVQAANGLIIDDFTFSPASFAGRVAVNLSSVSGPVSFFAGLFFADTPNELAFSNFSSGDFSFAADVSALTPLTLRVFGAVTAADGNLGGAGAYNVAITAAVAAIPEPQTYALLLAGLGVIGFAARRRRQALSS